MNGYTHVSGNLQEQNRHEVQLSVQFRLSSLKAMDVSSNVYRKLVVQVCTRLAASARQP